MNFMKKKLHFLGAILLLGVITQINGGNVFSQRGSVFARRLPKPEDGCGLTKVKNTRIVGGSEAPVGAYPWIAALAYYQAGEIVFDCGGSLITSKHVLTASHCLPEFQDASEEPKSLQFVRLGEHDLTSDDGMHQDVTIDLTLPHEDYDNDLLLNDIALIYLDYDVKYTDRVVPICLPLDEPLLSRSFVDANAFVAGWGDMFKDPSPAQVLMHLQVPIVDTKRCKQLIMRSNVVAEFVNLQISDHVICARLAGGKGTWIGDSGGPLMLPIHENGSFPFYQIGIVSMAYKFAARDSPDVYTKIQYYADWIRDHVELEP